MLISGWTITSDPSKKVIRPCVFLFFLSGNFFFFFCARVFVLFACWMIRCDLLRFGAFFGLLPSGKTLLKWPSNLHYVHSSLLRWEPGGAPPLPRPPLPRDFPRPRVWPCPPLVATRAVCLSSNVGPRFVHKFGGSNAGEMDGAGPVDLRTVDLKDWLIVRLKSKAKDGHHTYIVL